nr:root meristem growth factor 3 [Ipomoea batatas]
MLVATVRAHTISGCTVDCDLYFDGRTKGEKNDSGKVGAENGRAFAAGRWNFPSNGKVFIDTKHGPTTTTNKLKTRKLGMVEKGGDEGGASMQQRKMPGFVAYTLDYHPPKHHPPKNN